MSAKLKRLIALHYPVSHLPEDLRGEFKPDQRVTLTIEEEGPEGAEYATEIVDYSYLPLELVAEDERARKEARQGQAL